jgi:hypothetical protein
VIGPTTVVLLIVERFVIGDFESTKTHPKMPRSIVVRDRDVKSLEDLGVTSLTKNQLGGRIVQPIEGTPEPELVPELAEVSAVRSAIGVRLPLVRKFGPAGVAKSLQDDVVDLDHASSVFGS